MQRKRGGQPGNKNAIGNKGGAPLDNSNASGHGAPFGNKNAATHGLYSNIGIYGKGPIKYDQLSNRDKLIVNELLTDYGDVVSVDTLFRVIKFVNCKTPLYAIGCKNPYKALWHSTRLLMNECGKLWTKI